MQFYHQHYCFIDYCDDCVPDGAVTYAGDILFWYNEQEGTYTEFLGNPTGNIFLLASRDHECLLHHRGPAFYTPLES